MLVDMAAGLVREPDCRVSSCLPGSMGSSLQHALMLLAQMAWGIARPDLLLPSCTELERNRWMLLLRCNREQTQDRLL